MSIPMPHAPDEEWAEERVKRMMEPEAPLKTPAPGDKITASKDAVSEEEVPLTELASSTSNPTDDDGVDKIIDGPTSAKADGSAAETVDAVGTKDDVATDEAVTEIMKTDGDEALKAQDAASVPLVVMKPRLWERLKNDFSDWWDNPRERYITLGVLVLLLAVVFTFPSSRSFALNSVGFRSTVSITVLDATTGLPLKGATVDVQGHLAASNEVGKVSIAHVKLGNQTVEVKKSAFATTKETVRINMGTTKVANISLKAVGTQFAFTLTDYVSGKPITKAEVSSGTANAFSDAKGKVVLTVPPSSASNSSVTVTAEGYRTEHQTVAGTANSTTSIALVPNIKDVFISKQTGKYDLYTADLDGKNRKVILAATGTETDGMQMQVSVDNSKAALVSTRDNQHDSDGYLLSTLTLVDVKTGSSQALEHAERVSLLGWSATRLVYKVTVAGASAANPNRERILSYDYASGKRQQLASVNGFNDFFMTGDTVYYSVSNTDPSGVMGVSKINSDGTSKQVVTTQEVWTMLRTSYTTLNLQTNSGWLSYVLGVSGTKPTGTPSSFGSKTYLNNPDNTKSLWVDSRDGKGVLLTYDITSAKDTIIATQEGLSTPLRWLNSTTVIYRVGTAKETADYVVSSLGGQPKKITDVTFTAAN